MGKTSYQKKKNRENKTDEQKQKQNDYQKNIEKK